MIGWFASGRHLVDHLASLWKACPSELRLPMVVEAGLLDHCAALGIDARPGWRWPGDLTVVAAHSDLPHGSTHPIVLVEHGAGQRYQGITHGGYPGGRGREMVRLFVCPNAEVAGANLAAYPGSRAAVVGCPRLDRWHVRPRSFTHAPDRPVVAISAHWDCLLVPETTPALPWHREALPGLLERFEVLGHYHPRGAPQMIPMWAKLGVEIVADWAEVLDRADLFVCDNSSAMYEAAAIGMPVLALNAPWYRVNVHHGLRFWSHVPGPQADVAVDVLPTLERMVEGRTNARHLGNWAAARAYAYRDGRATALAVEAILDCHEEVLGEH